MGNFDQDADDGVTPRRRFFSRIAAASAFGLFGLATNTRAQPAPSGGPNWPGSLKSSHRQVFDIYGINEGFPLGFVNNFLAPNQSATAVLIFRHLGTPYALNNAIWGKYKVGEVARIMDLQTKRPFVKNPWYEPNPGISPEPDITLDRLIARGAMIGVCRVSLRAASRSLAANAGVTSDEAFNEIAANLIPGAAIIPSGTWGLNRAQEAGCTYCAGG
jgi:hypothetical protein